MNESEEAQSLREEQKKQTTAKVSQSSNTNAPNLQKVPNKIPKSIKLAINKDYEEEENDSDDPKHQNIPKNVEPPQQVIMFDMNQFYNLNVGNDVKELLQFMNK